MSPPHSVSPPLYSNNAYQQAVKPTTPIEPAATNNNNIRLKNEPAAINSPPTSMRMKINVEDQVVPLDLMTKVQGKENQAQDLTMSTLKSRQPLSNVNITVQNDKWRPW